MIKRELIILYIHLYGQLREIDNLPGIERTAIRSTFAAGESQSELWTALLNLTALVYKELEGVNGLLLRRCFMIIMPVSDDDRRAGWS